MNYHFLPFRCKMMVGDDECCHLTSDKQPAGVNTLGDEEEDQFNKRSSNTGINNTIDSASRRCLKEFEIKAKCLELSAAFVWLSSNDFNTLITLLLNLTICIINLTVGVINRSKPIIALTSVVLTFISVYLIIFFVSVFHKGLLHSWVYSFSSLLSCFFFSLQLVLDGQFAWCFRVRG